jgi:hypothetical protein
LTSIYLYNNQIGVEGAKAIASALERNQNLTSINLSGNRIGDELLSQINAIIKRNCQIRDDFLKLVRRVITQGGQDSQKSSTSSETIKKAVNQTPLVHQIYTLVEIIKEAGKLGNQDKDITGHLMMIGFLLDHNPSIEINHLKESVLDVLKEGKNKAKNSQIEELFKSRGMQMGKMKMEDKRDDVNDSSPDTVSMASDLAATSDSLSASRRSENPRVSQITRDSQNSQTFQASQSPTTSLAASSATTATEFAKPGLKKR